MRDYGGGCTAQHQYRVTHQVKVRQTLAFLDFDLYAPLPCTGGNLPELALYYVGSIAHVPYQNQ